MKISCPCGATIHDGADDLPHRAHFIPDRQWNRLFEAIDELIEKRCLTAAQREAACMEIRRRVGAVARQAWQCRECGRIFADDETFQLQGYVPQDASVSRQLFAR